MTNHANDNPNRTCIRANPRLALKLYLTWYLEVNQNLMRHTKPLGLMIGCYSAGLLNAGHIP